MSEIQRFYLSIASFHYSVESFKFNRRELGMSFVSPSGDLARFVCHHYRPQPFSGFYDPSLTELQQSHSLITTTLES